MEKNENYVAKATFLGSYQRSTTKTIFDPISQAEVKEVVTAQKYRYKLDFASTEERNAFIESNSTESYTPLQEDGSVVTQQNNLLPGSMLQRGHECLAEVAILADGKHVILTKDEVVLHFAAEADRKVQSAKDPVLKAEIARALASVALEEQQELREQKLAMQASRKAAQAAKLAAFGKAPSDAKASKDKLDVK